MRKVEYRGRRAVQIENDQIRVTLLLEGGHVAEILHKATGVNPLWTPPWPSIEPSSYRPDKHPAYGHDAESKLLCGIMGHNLCLDVFGGPSEEEAAAGMTVHGEASVNLYDAEARGETAVLRTSLLHAQLSFERVITLHGDRVRFEESVQNLSPLDRPIAWTQHVTIGPPFLEHGSTRFELTATRGKTYEADFGAVYPQGVEFLWPNAPVKKGGVLDLRVYPDAAESAGYTAQLMDPEKELAWFAGISPKSGVGFGYRWRRADFPWCGIWEENRSRKTAPWNGRTVTRGMEFGVSPMPETRRQMIERGKLFDTPGYRWAPARQRLVVEYEARIAKPASPDLLNFFR